MKIALVLALFLGVASATRIPVHGKVPMWKLNPRLTLGEWQEILAAQVPQPEFVPNYKKGNEMPDHLAGVTEVKTDLKNGRITGGSAAVTGQFPWQVSNTMDGTYFCGASILSETVIMTAAHCVDGFSTWVLVIGSLNIDGGTPGSRTLTSRNAMRHALYNPDTIQNDIGIIWTPEALEFSGLIRPVRLPTRSHEGNTYSQVELSVSGWGRTSDSSGLPTGMRYVALTGMNNAICSGVYGDIVIYSTLCCATENGQSTCSGDSGGALTHLEDDGLHTQVGIVSFGASDGCTLGYPAGFSRVTAFLSWIESATGIVILP